MKNVNAHLKLLGVALLAGSLVFAGCSTINAFSNLKKIQFKLGDVNSFKLAGVDISKLSSPTSISGTDALKLTQAFANKQLPVGFTLNVLAKNPNTGSGSSKATDMVIKKMDWTLYIDGNETIDGTVGNRIQLPGNGQTTTIPLSMNLDLMKFFSNKGYNDLLNLAFALGGVSGSSSRLKLTSKVTVEVPLLGDWTIPSEFTIVNTEFSNP